MQGCFLFPFLPGEPNAPEPNAPEPNVPEPNAPEPNEPEPGDSGLTGKYVGSARCQLCHTRVHEAWSETHHAEALETLEGIGQGTNPVCLACHTVGFGEDGGFVDRATTNSLAGVGCEKCHGPGLDHVSNVSDASLRPPKPIGAEVCGECHTDAHHPTFDEWSESGHAEVTEHVAEGIAAGDSGRLTGCGVCHSGDYRVMAIIGGDEVEDDTLQGTDPNDLNGVTCAVCHGPHQINASDASNEHEHLLRYPLTAFPVQSNSVDDVQDPDRFNLCGQCHHSRGRTWDATSRGPHHSVQSNIYVGEMPMPAGEEAMPLVPNEGSIHSFAPEQCVTCHMLHRDFVSEEDPAHTGHTFEPDPTAGCTGAGCHPTSADAVARMAVTQTAVQTRLDAIAARLGDVSTWEYECCGGPDEAGQAALSDGIKKIRFLYHYMDSDGSLGVHNPQYYDAMLDEAERLLDDEGL